MVLDLLKKSLKISGSKSTSNSNQQKDDIPSDNKVDENNNPSFEKKVEDSHSPLSLQTNTKKSNINASKSKKIIKKIIKKWQHSGEETGNIQLDKINEEESSLYFSFGYELESDSSQNRTSRSRSRSNTIDILEDEPSKWKFNIEYLPIFTLNLCDNEGAMKVNSSSRHLQQWTQKVNEIYSLVVMNVNDVQNRKSISPSSSSSSPSSKRSPNINTNIHGNEINNTKKSNRNSKLNNSLTTSTIMSLANEGLESSKKLISSTNTNIDLREMINTYLWSQISITNNSLTCLLNICAEVYLELFAEEKSVAPDLYSSTYISAFENEIEPVTQVSQTNQSQQQQNYNQHHLVGGLSLSKSISLCETDEFDLQSEEFNKNLEILEYKKRLNKREEEAKELMKKEEELYNEQLSLEINKRGIVDISRKSKVKQIFSPNGANAILINDLIEIMKNSEELGFSAKAIEDNVYHWRVKFFGFDSTCNLGNQLRTINKKFHYNYVEMEVTFTMDLHPFYPPLVKLIRPRFLGYMMAKITCMDQLKLSHWNPVKDMKTVLSQIRSLIRETGSVDVENPSNNIKLFPEGSYTDLEFLLLRLELLSEQESRSSIKFKKSSDSLTDEQKKKIKEKDDIISNEKNQIQSLSSNSNTNNVGNSNHSGPNSSSSYVVEQTTNNNSNGNNSSTSSPQTYWAKGTGYGHSHNHSQNGKAAVWDVQAYLAAQKEKNFQTQEVLLGIEQFLKREVIPIGQFEAIEESCLIPVFESYLRNDSLLDMGRNAPLYITILGVVKVLASHESLVPLLDTLPFQDKSLYSLLKILQSQANIFVKRVVSESENANPNDSLEFEMATAILEAFEIVLNSLRKNKEKNKEKEQKNKKAEKSDIEDSKIVKLLEEKDNALNALTMKIEEAVVTSDDSQLKIQESLEKISEDKNTESAYVKMESRDTEKVNEKEGKQEIDRVEEISKEKEYEKYMKNLQYDTSEIQQYKGSNMYHYLNHESGSYIPREKIMRLAQEQGSLLTSLPLNLSSSVFVRVDDQRIDMLQSIITGPIDTPYDCGCFLFDVYFPLLYPANPPLVNLQTTGGGSVRFNPNLYNCGKVCLSLLGTWNGAEGETWNKDTSTLLQVLVSIQSLIFVQFPYFNEPGHERQIGSRNGEDSSRRYNEVIRVATVEIAMVAQLKRPSLGFESVIKNHFYLKKQHVLKTVESWLEEGKNSHSHHTRLNKAYLELKEELNKLPPPVLVEDTIDDF